MKPGAEQAQLRERNTRLCSRVRRADCSTPCFYVRRYRIILVPRSNVSRRILPRRGAGSARPPPHPAAYLDPSFEAMVRCQLRFAEEGYAKLSNVQRYFADNVRDEYANGQLDAQVEGVLNEMKDLTIYGA